MSILGLLIVLLIIALLLPAVGVSLDPQIMRIVTVVIVIALIVWLFTGGVAGLRV